VIAANMSVQPVDMTNVSRRLKIEIKNIAFS